MKKLQSLLLATLVMLAGCGEINDRLDNLEGRVDAIENSKITTIEQQIVAINTTLSTLVTADANLKDYIISLQEQATELEASIATTNQKIDQMKESLEGEIDANVASVAYLDADKKFKNQIEYADKIKTKFSAIIGEDEVKSQVVMLKNMQTGEQQKLSVTDVIKVVLGA